MEKYTLKQFNQDFPDDDAYLEFISQSRWPDGIHCAKCDAVTSHHHIKGRKVYSCSGCGSPVAPTVDTIFHKSWTPLLTWFYAIFLMVSTRTCISAKHLERGTGVTCKTAWRMFTEIRKLMAQDEGLQLFGEVEVDETYVGGKERNKHASKKLNAGRGPVGKTTVVGLVEHQGNAVVKVQPNSRSETLLPMIQNHVTADDAVVFTDEYMGYNRLSILGYAHERVRHRDQGVHRRPRSYQQHRGVLEQYQARYRRSSPHRQPEAP